MLFIHAFMYECIEWIEIDSKLSYFDYTFDFLLENNKKQIQVIEIIKGFKIVQLLHKN